MKCILKNAAPLDERLQMWGDYHFGAAVARALAQLGWEVESHYYGEWEKVDEADLVLVLRGKQAYVPPETARAGRYVIWVISHPAEVSPEELRAYDHVFVSSLTHQEMLARENIRSQVLLQCTDPDRFSPADVARQRRGFVFVGNTRSEERPVVRQALEAGLPVRIWGRGWAEFGLSAHVVDRYLPNEDLPEIYRSARCTLNDHWPDMREYGYVNNRIFDALACGLPVLTDWHEGVEALDCDAILSFRNQREFCKQMQRLLLEYPLLLEAAADASEWVRREHSFSHRAEQIAAAVEG